MGRVRRISWRTLRCGCARPGTCRRQAPIGLPLLISWNLAWTTSTRSTSCSAPSCRLADSAYLFRQLITSQRRGSDEVTRDDTQSGRLDVVSSSDQCGDLLVRRCSATIAFEFYSARTASDIAMPRHPIVTFAARGQVPALWPPVRGWKAPTCASPAVGAQRRSTCWVCGSAHSSRCLYRTERRDFKIAGQSDARRATRVATVEVSTGVHARSRGPVAGRHSRLAEHI